ncbi:hypothetical protein SFOMI_3378 [Sphingobium fuliginis]|uniref:Uncharacterized protein n=1 Tax=Sphingobium fuliginis (strain ATCC 27551) TaxID=336203 RepID=A0A292ZIQ8_SPHSA|nr:hypothetical protein SFOMI_3378 [Sphingobium fuliginis]
MLDEIPKHAGQAYLLFVRKAVATKPNDTMIEPRRAHLSYLTLVELLEVETNDVGSKSIGGWNDLES